ncbi:hypothetical protein B9479_007272 [Cryptococcus floricola]|uniref:O-methyltransferase n=1 Tax=Cryptococcus floricola TaxID=2591691 RepID=A0A5D3AN79_9TREE|nr:hypothetical protein B9479_007272 [Cryptococcus floricola]
MFPRLAPRPLYNTAPRLLHRPSLTLARNMTTPTPVWKPDASYERRDMPPADGGEPSSGPTAGQVDAYLAPKLLHPSYGADPALPAIQSRALEAGIPAISVSPLQGQFLSILALSLGAERILEVGTLAGYSTAFLSKALPGHGQVDTLELDPHHAAVAQENFLNADLFPFPTIHVGPALETLKRLEKPAEGAYDLVFIDADKEGTLGYVKEGLRLLRKGGVVVVDNAVRSGKIALSREEEPSPNVDGMRRLFDWIEQDGGRTVLANVTQTVGAKSWDGFAILYKLVE